MKDGFTAAETCKAAGITRPQLDKWISLGYLPFERQPGRQRLYDLWSIRTVATFAELVALGLSPSRASLHVRFLKTYNDGRVILAIWQGHVELLQSSERGSPMPEKGSGAFVYDPSNPAAYSHDEIVRPEDIPEMIADPLKRGVIVVNIDHVEKRILDELGLTREQAHALEPASLEPDA